MKKYLLLIALFAAQAIYADGFANLKALQNQVHVLVAQAGAIAGAARSAPEVPYIAGLLSLRESPSERIVGNEAPYIYNVLRTASHPAAKAIHVPQGLDQEKVAALNQFDPAVFRYHGYLHSGHTVFGIAAQEQLPLIPRIVIERVIPGNPVLVSAVSPPAGGGGMGGIFGGGVPKLKKVEQPAEIKPAAATKTQIQRVQEYKALLDAKAVKSPDDPADIAILTAFETELQKPKLEQDEDMIKRYTEFFGYLETPTTMTGNPMSGMMMKGLRNQFKPRVDTTDTSTELSAKKGGNLGAFGGEGSAAVSAILARGIHLNKEDKEDSKEKLAFEKKIKAQISSINSQIPYFDEEMPENLAAAVELSKFELLARTLKTIQDDLESAYEDDIPDNIDALNSALKKLTKIISLKKERYLSDEELIGQTAEVQAAYKAERDKHDNDVTKSLPFVLRGQLGIHVIKSKSDKTPEQIKEAEMRRAAEEEMRRVEEENARRAAAIKSPVGKGVAVGAARRGSVAAGGGALSKEEKAARKVEIETRIGEINQEMTAGTMTTMKGNREIAELRQELSRLG